MLVWGGTSGSATHQGSCLLVLGSTYGVPGIGPCRPYAKQVPHLLHLKFLKWERTSFCIVILFVKMFAEMADGCVKMELCQL